MIRLIDIEHDTVLCIDDYNVVIRNGIRLKAIIVSAVGRVVERKLMNHAHRLGLKIYCILDGIIDSSNIFLNRANSHNGKFMLENFPIDTTFYVVSEECADVLKSMGYKIIKTYTPKYLQV